MIQLTNFEEARINRSAIAIEVVGNLKTRLTLTLLNPTQRRCAERALARRMEK